MFIIVHDCTCMYIHVGEMPRPEPVPTSTGRNGLAPRSCTLIIYCTFIIIHDTVIVYNMYKITVCIHPYIHP